MPGGYFGPPRKQDRNPCVLAQLVSGPMVWRIAQPGLASETKRSMDEPTTKPRRGCFHFGCIAGLILMLVMLVGGLIGLYYAKKMFNDFTDTKPAQLPQVQMSPAEIDRLEQRLDTFRAAIRSGKPTEPLTLSADEINALMQNDPDFSALKGKLYVTFEADQIKGQLSLAMQEVGLSIFKGRYLNGTGTFSLSLQRGRILLHLLTFAVKNKHVPEVYMQEIRKHNFAENFNSNPRAKAALDRLQDIKIHEGKLTVLPKPAGQE